MPVFDYRCNECEHEFSELVARDARDSVSCPRCESGNTTRKVSLFSGCKSSCSSPGGSSGFT